MILPTLTFLLSRASADDPDQVEHVAAPPAHDSLEAEFGLVVARDLRAEPRPPGGRGRSLRVRPWSQIVGLTWHQTGTPHLGPDHPGLPTIPAHLLLHLDGTCTLLHDARNYVQHGNALNAGTIGIEIVCRAAGTEGDASTFWRSPRERLGYHAKTRTHPVSVGPTTGHPGRWHPPKTYAELVHEATDLQFAQIPLIARYYAAMAERAGGSIAGHWAHRQGTDDRGSDPGSRIYKVVDRTRAELGLRDVSQLTLGRGQPVPAAWRS